LADQLRQLRDKATASLGPEAVEAAPKAAVPQQVVQQATALPPSAATPRLDGTSSHDLGWPAAPGGKGGGAVDPITALAAAGIALAAVARRSRKAGDAK